MAKRYSDLSAEKRQLVQEFFGRRYGYTGTNPTGGAETKHQFCTRRAEEWIVAEALAQRGDESARDESDL